jgi:hypothetical protein
MFSVILASLLTFSNAAQIGNQDFTTAFSNKIDTNPDFQAAYIKRNNAMLIARNYQQSAMTGAPVDLNIIGNQFKALADAQTSEQMRQAYLDQWNNFTTAFSNKIDCAQSGAKPTICFSMHD